MYVYMCVYVRSREIFAFEFELNVYNFERGLRRDFDFVFDLRGDP